MAHRLLALCHGPDPRRGETAAKTGSDIKMDEAYPERVRMAYDAGAIIEMELDTCARSVPELIRKG